MIIHCYGGLQQKEDTANNLHTRSKSHFAGPDMKTLEKRLHNAGIQCTIAYTKGVSV